MASSCCNCLRGGRLNRAGEARPGPDLTNLFQMTDSLEIGAHLCDGGVTDASRLTGAAGTPGATWYLASSPGKTPLSAPAAAGTVSPSG